jgi:hypothetical protein
MTQAVRVHVDSPPVGKQEKRISLGIGLGKVVSREKFTKNVCPNNENQGKGRSMVSIWQ